METNIVRRFPTPAKNFEAGLPRNSTGDLLHIQRTEPPIYIYIQVYRSIVNVRDLELECARVLHERLLVPVLTYGNDKMLRKKERSRIKAVQMDIGLFGIRRMDRFPSAQIS